jgi:hypothetical protein
MAGVRRKRGGAAVAPITAWSYSRLSTFDTCRLLAKFLYVDKLKQPETPAMKNGKVVHKQAEDYLNKSASYPSHRSWEGADWQTELSGLLANKYTPELQIAFTREWKPTDWFGSSTWARMVLDATKCTNNLFAHAIDYKTGRIYEDHGDQAELYAVGCLKYFGNPDEVRVDFWYLDQQEIHEYEFTRRTIEDDLVPKWEERANEICNETDFEPTPGRASCGKYGGCQFAANKGGQCAYTTKGVLA